MTIQASSSPWVVTTGPPAASSAEEAQAVGGGGATRQLFASSRLPGSARLADVNVLELLFVKRRSRGARGSCQDDDDEDEDEDEDGTRFWHLSGPLDPSLPFFEAPESFICCSKEANLPDSLVDVAARVSDGAGGDLWLRASGRPLAAAATPAVDIGGGGERDASSLPPPFLSKIFASVASSKRKESAVILIMNN